MSKLKLKKQTISNFVDNEYRNFALYALEFRAIPSFYDSLTNVRRFIVQYTPNSFIKCDAVIGACMGTGLYHHGPASLGNSINGLAQDYMCADKILDGSGFFGNAIDSEASATRYTSVKLNAQAKEHLKKYSSLNSTNENGWNPLKMEIPIGICSYITGIALGYSCSMLPRKLEHVQEYLDGKRKSLKPYLMNFKGKIIKNADNPDRSSWKILPVIEIDESKRTIHVTEISPSISYSTYVKKINNLIDTYNCSVVNNTRESIDIKLKFPRKTTDADWDKIVTKIDKDSTATITENILFIKDSSVLQYNKIEDYLDDFKNYREFLYLEKMEYDLVVLDSELEFLKAKKEYLEFMMQKKRKQDEIEKFLSKYNKEIYSRLDSLKLRLLNNEYLKKTIQEIEDYKKDIKSKNKEIVSQRKTCSKIKDIIIKAKTSKINA